MEWLENEIDADEVNGMGRAAQKKKERKNISNIAVE